jgi:hypothetical protein
MNRSGGCLSRDTVVLTSGRDIRGMSPRGPYCYGYEIMLGLEMLLIHRYLSSYNHGSHPAYIHPLSEADSRMSEMY